MPKVRLASTIGWGFPSWKEEDEARLLQEFGLRHVQLFRNTALPFDPRQARRLLADHGIEIVSMHARFGDEFDPSLPDETARQHAVDCLAAEADVCLALGGQLIVVHPGNANIGQETRSPRRIDALKRAAAHLARVAEKSGLLFALENLQPGQMGDDMPMLRRIVDEIDSPRLGLNYDCGHAHLAAGALPVLEAGGPRIIATHIHDNSGHADDHIVPGTGTIDMDAVCRGLARIDYHGDFVLELMESTESLRAKCTRAWQLKLMRWLALANGLKA